jgi:hypothetical protein
MTHYIGLFWNHALEHGTGSAKLQVTAYEFQVPPY